MGRKRKIAGLAALAILASGFLFPEHPVIPVQGASERDWNHNTFWYEPWGRSGVHKGIDIFAAEGVPVLSATGGAVLYAGQLSQGGKVVLILGPKWRLHYYAHLAGLDTSAGSLVGSGEPVGRVGTSGNAVGKPPHLHYAILSLVPYPWRWDTSTQGWKKSFFLNPSEYLLNR